LVGVVVGKTVAVEFAVSVTLEPAEPPVSVALTVVPLAAVFPPFFPFLFPPFLCPAFAVELTALVVTFEMLVLLRAMAVALTELTSVVLLKEPAMFVQFALLVALAPVTVAL